MISEQPVVLIGDPNLKRFKLLRQILADEFELDATRAETFHELRGNLDRIQLKLNLKLILIAEDLPYSVTKRTVVIPHYFMNLGEALVGAPLGCIFSNARPDVLGIASPIYVHVGSTRPNLEQRRLLIGQLETVLPRTRRPEVSLENDPILREQVRSLSETHDEQDGKKQLARLVSKFFNCHNVEVARLSQGQSGARVFRIQPDVQDRTPAVYLLKLSPAGDVWKAKLEVKQYLKAARHLEEGSYRTHVPLLIESPLPLPDGPDLSRHLVFNGRWYAVCYSFLGGPELGKFVDLATALVAGSQSLFNSAEMPRPDIDPYAWGVRAFEAIVSWLCSVWYLNASLVKRESRSLWKLTDAPEKELLPLPPYRLAARKKGFILGFFDRSACQLGVRLLSNWKYHCETVRLFVDRSGGKTGVTHLDDPVSVLLCPSHGDLNANNLFVWLKHPDQPFLIDFPFYQDMGHALQDLARLEVEIKFALMDRQEINPAGGPLAFDYTFSQVPLWQQMEDHLLSPEWNSDQLVWAKSGYEENVRTCLRLVQFLRTKAREIQQQNCGVNLIPSFLDEYRPALLYHTLQAIGYPSLSVFKRLLAVHSAGSILNQLGFNP